MVAYTGTILGLHKHLNTNVTVRQALTLQSAISNFTTKISTSLTLKIFSAKRESGFSCFALDSVEIHNLESPHVCVVILDIRRSLEYLRSKLFELFKF